MSLLSLVFFSSLHICCRKITANTSGTWSLVQSSIGISAMHMQLLNNDRVIIFDRTDFGFSNLSLPDGKCRHNPKDLAFETDCTAHSVEYDVNSNTIRPLFVQTDVWCSSGAVSGDGHLIQTGGFNDGENVVREFHPCGNCDWKELNSSLAVRRWYASDHILPDGRVIIIGGRRQFNYEFFPKSEITRGVFFLPFLKETKDVEENNLYPFVHLNVDGNLFIFANNWGILFDYRKNVVVKTYPKMPGADPRNYPSSGSSVLLPLKNLHSPITSLQAEVLICGGAPAGSYTQANKRNFIPALDTCGRIKITDSSPNWIMESMPMKRVMSDMILLPNGNVLIINGASSGSAGWELGRDPVLNPIIYSPNNQLGNRFEVQNPGKIPRMYHSSAVLLRDGRILVGGSNPHKYYNFTDVLYPTDLSLETFSPSYLDSQLTSKRAKIATPTSQSVLKYGEKFVVTFTISEKLQNGGITVSIVSPPFTTHSFSMSQRLLVLDSEMAETLDLNSSYEVAVWAPNSPFLAPSGYYLLFVVNQGIPSEGIWVLIQ